jgi:hypothetical protein
VGVGKGRAGLLGARGVWWAWGWELLNFILQVPENSIKNSISGKSVIIIEVVVGGRLCVCGRVLLCPGGCFSFGGVLFA